MARQFTEQTTYLGPPAQHYGFGPAGPTSLRSKTRSLYAGVAADRAVGRGRSGFGSVSSTDFLVASASSQPAVQSLLYQRGALIYAATSDVDKTAKALGLAEEALTVADDGARPEWAMWAHNPTERRIVAGRCWAELHRPLRAVPFLETAMSVYDSSYARDKALYLTWLADAYLDAGELEHATEVTSHALDLANGVAQPARRSASARC